MGIQVLAFDSNEQQLTQVLQHPKITYKQGSAEVIEVPNHTADLLTTAQAVHWYLQIPAFLFYS